MTIDFRAPRLYVEAPLSADAALDLSPAQAHYLCDVLRLGDGAAVLAFNGHDGEWTTRLLAAGKKRWRLLPEARTRPQSEPSDLHYLFAPLKHARLDYMVEKA